MKKDVAAITVQTVVNALPKAASTAQDLAAPAVALPADSAEVADAKPAPVRAGESRLPLLARLLAAMARDAEIATTRDLHADTVVVVDAPDAVLANYLGLPPADTAMEEAAPDAVLAELSPRRASAALTVLAIVIALTDPVATRARASSPFARTAVAEAASNAVLHALIAVESVARAAPTRDGTHQLLRSLDAPMVNAIPNTKFAAITKDVHLVNAPSRARETAAVAQDAPRADAPSRASLTVAEAQDVLTVDAPSRVANLTAAEAQVAPRVDAPSRANLTAAEAQDAPREDAQSRARLAAVTALDAHPEAAKSSVSAALSAEAVDADLAPVEAISPDLPPRPVTPDTLSLDLTLPRRLQCASTAMVPAVKDVALPATHATVLAAPSATTMATSSREAARSSPRRTAAQAEAAPLADAARAPADANTAVASAAPDATTSLTRLLGMTSAPGAVELAASTATTTRL